MGIKVADGIKVTNQLTQRWGGNLGYLGESNVITKVLRSRRSQKGCVRVMRYEKD